MPHNSFPLFGEYDQFYRLGKLNVQNDEGGLEPDPRSAMRAWGAAALLIATIFVFLILAVPRERDVVATNLLQGMPKESVAAIPAFISSTGNACPMLCSVTADRLQSGALLVGCSRTSSPTSCTDPARFTLSVSRNTGGG
jgi:hypothetical protein